MSAVQLNATVTNARLPIIQFEYSSSNLIFRMSCCTTVQLIASLVQTTMTAGQLSCYSPRLFINQ